MSASDDHRGQVVLQGATSATEVYLIDSAFELKGRALRRLEAAVEPGVYKARFQLGGELQDQRFVVEPGERVEITGQPMTVLSAVPLAGTRWPAGSAPADVPAIWRRASSAEGDGPGVLTVLLRCDGSAARPQLELASLAGEQGPALRWQEVSGWQVASVRLPAGTHVLWVVDGGERLCRSLPVLDGQQTALVIHLPGEPDTDDETLEALLGSALLIGAYPIAGDEEELLRQLITQQVLRRSRALEAPGDGDLASLSPLTLLLRAHGLLEATRTHLSHPLDPLRLPQAVREEVKAACARLRTTGLNGCADVEALAMAVDEPSQAVNLDVPPLLASTWRTLITASLGGRQIQGGLPALRMAQGMMASSLWLTWQAPAAGAPPQEEQLSAVARDLLEPELRPSSLRLPSWTESSKLLGLAKNRTTLLARGLQLPTSLVQELVRNMRDERAAARRERALRRISALRSGAAKVCLVVLPDSARIDPTRGQPLDLDAVMDDLVGAAADGAGLVAVRAPPVGVAAAETREALSTADVLVIDTTFADPEAERASGFWLALHPERSPIYLQAEGFSSAAKPGATVFAYSAAFGTGVSFPDAGRVARALESAAAQAAPPDGPERRRWLERLARLEERQLELQSLAAQAHELSVEGKEDAAAALLQARLAPDSLREEPSAIQLAAFLLCRAVGDPAGMERLAGAMRPELLAIPLVREQLALAMKWSGAPERMMEGTKLLAGVLQEIGDNGETCGLLGGIFKELWLRGAGGAKEARKWRDLAIHWYRVGFERSPQDPYPGVNLLTLLASEGTPTALAEHAQRLQQVEDAVTWRLRHRPNYWDLVSMLEVAANRGDESTCRRFLCLALDAPRGARAGKATAKNLGILRDAPGPTFKAAAGWLEELAGALAAAPAWAG